MPSRRRVLLSSLAVLLLLDLGRSWYARVGAATPTRLWSPDPASARAIAWPPGNDLTPGSPVGQRVYAEHCAVCHGPDGRGNGPAAPSLRPRPRDFTRGIFKLKSTPQDQPPRLEDVRAVIATGMPGSSMPAWQDLLSADEITAVAAYVRNFGPYTAWAPAAPAAALPPASAVRGQTAYAALGCAACHGAGGRGDGGSAKDLKDVWNQPDRPRDLTAPWTFRGGSSDTALYTRIAGGMPGTPMPGYAEVADAQQIADVIAYLGSMARRPAWEPNGTFDTFEQSDDPVRRGEYLVHAGMCGLCHTPVDGDGIYLADTHYLAGGMKVEAGAHGIYFTRNLTPDLATGLGRWTLPEIAHAIRTGHTPERRLNYWGMPWMVLGALSADDALAIAHYLKTLPAVHNRVPDPLHYGVIETVLRKATYSFPAAMPRRLAYFAGNFGYEQPTVMGRDLPQSVLIWAQLAALAIGLFAMWFLPRPVQLEPSLGLSLIKTVLLVACGGAVFVIYRYPALDFLPSADIVDAFSAAIPEIKTDGLSADQAALLRRGRYLYGIASCAYCHNGDGAGGGKVNWQVLGTTWARNLTADPSGLSTWSDAAVLRAMVSGVRPDGRPLHWQAMIWDHVSNYSMQDQHALLAYMRALPAVHRRLPAPVAPRPGDCSGDTFWIGATNDEPGCR